MFAAVEASSVDVVGVVTVVGVAFALGLYVAFVYRWATPAAAFSIGIQHTLVFLALVVSLVMLIIGNEIARAFTLVGAMAVVRFRTPVKDARDAAFIFMALAAGMGAGVGLYPETAVGTALIGLLMVAVRRLRVGMHPAGEVLVKLGLAAGADGESVHGVLERHLHPVQLQSTRASGHDDRLELTFAGRPRRDADLASFARELARHPGVERSTVVVPDDEGLAADVF